MTTLKNYSGWFLKRTSFVMHFKFQSQSSCFDLKSSSEKRWPVVQSDGQFCDVVHEQSAETEHFSQSLGPQASSCRSTRNIVAQIMNTFAGSKRSSVNAISTGQL